MGLYETFKKRIRVLTKINKFVESSFNVTEKRKSADAFNIVLSWLKIY